jgi:glycosyltransferase involved in cell wall biosynthesis
MKVSIAMCTFNGARYLPEQLRSIARQSAPPDELVVCDDGSSDETLKILEHCEQASPFPVRIFRNIKNLGYTKNFEQAISLCTGALIALSDQDDLWYPEKLATLTSVLATNTTAGGVFSDGDVLDSDARVIGSLWRSFGFNEQEQTFFRSGQPIDVCLKGNRVTGMTLMFRSELRPVMLPVPDCWDHDGWLSWMLILSSRLIADPRRLVGYRTHGEQQIGAPRSALQKLRWISRHGIPEFLQVLRSNTLNENEKLAVQFQALAAHLQNSSEPLSRTVRERALEKAGHARARIAILSQPRMMRLQGIWRHSSGYCKYSPSPGRTIATDLIA